MFLQLKPHFGSFLSDGGDVIQRSVRAAASFLSYVAITENVSCLKLLAKYGFRSWLQNRKKKYHHG